VPYNTRRKSKLIYSSSKKQWFTTVFCSVMESCSNVVIKWFYTPLLVLFVSTTVKATVLLSSTRTGVLRVNNVYRPSHSQRACSTCTVLSTVQFTKRNTRLTYVFIRCWSVFWVYWSTLPLRVAGELRSSLYLNYCNIYAFVWRCKSAHSIRQAIIQLLWCIVQIMHAHSKRLPQPLFVPVTSYVLFLVNLSPQLPWFGRQFDCQCLLLWWSGRRLHRPRHY
jgi:hypothetical protein